MWANGWLVVDVKCFSPTEQSTNLVASRNSIAVARFKLKLKCKLVCKQSPLAYFIIFYAAAVGLRLSDNKSENEVAVEGIAVLHTSHRPVNK